MAIWRQHFSRTRQGVYVALSILFVVVLASIPFALSQAPVESSSPRATQGFGVKDQAVKSLPPFSLEETIGMAFLQPDSDGEDTFAHRANPAAREHLWKILAVKELKLFHPNAVVLLGHCGNDADVEQFKTWIITKYTGVLNSDDGKCVAQIILSLGRMSRRGNNTATELLTRMLDPEFWKDAKFRWLPKEYDSRQPFAYDTFEIVSYACTNAGIEKIDEVCDEFLKAIDDDRVRNHYASRVSKNNRAYFVEKHTVNAPPAAFRARLLELYEKHASAIGLTSKTQAIETPNAQANSDNRNGPALTPATARELISAGDGAVVATLIDWLDQYGEAEEVEKGELGPEELWVAIDGVKQFRVAAALPALHRLYQIKSTHQALRLPAADVIARINHDASLGTIQAMLNDATLDEMTRCHAAQALVDRDLDAGRDYLMKGYQQYLANVRKGVVRGGEACACLEEMSDAALLEKVRGLFAAEPAGIPRNNLRTVMAAIEINRLPEAELWKAACSNQFDLEGRQWVAIEALGRTSRSEVIAKLEQFLPSGTEVTKEDRVKQFYLKEIAAKSIAEIKRRQWASAQKPPADLAERVKLAIDTATRFGANDFDAKQTAFYCNQAVKEFAAIKKIAESRDFDALLGQLLDNGKVIDLNDIPRPEAFKARLARIHTHIKAINATKVTECEFRVVRPKPPAESNAVPRDEIVVTFKLAGTSQIGKTLGPHASGVTTDAKDGCLIVVMKQIDGKWYWNPFGW